MPSILRPLLGLLIVSGLWSSDVVHAARAEPPARSVFAEVGPFTILGSGADALSLGLGAFDLSVDEMSAAGTVEYRFGRKLWFIGPALGLVANTDGGVVGYGGVYMDVAHGPLHFTPVLGIAGVHEGGGRNLGSRFLFRAQGDLTWRFADDSRVGLRFAHISNANTNDPNPGEEELFLLYTIPMGPYF